MKQRRTQIGFERQWLAFSATRAAIGVFAAQILLGVGCTEEDCNVGEVRCNDGNAEICVALEHAGGRHWSISDCSPGTCVRSNELPDEAVCVRDAKPDLRCASNQSFSLCDGSEVIDCWEGLVIHSLNCETGAAYPAHGELGPVLFSSSAPSGYCQNVRDTAFCALEPTSNLACANFAVDTCEGADALHCNSGYVVGRVECGNSGTVCNPRGGCENP